MPDTRRLQQPMGLRYRTHPVGKVLTRFHRIVAQQADLPVASDLAGVTEHHREECELHEINQPG